MSDSANSFWVLPFGKTKSILITEVIEMNLVPFVWPLYNPKSIWIFRLFIIIIVKRRLLFRRS